MSEQRSLPICVVVPVYNDELYIAECLRSLRDQTAAPAEIILIDNASTDGSVDRAQALNLPNLRLIRNSENLGATAARNIGLEASTQPYVVNLDSDDFLALDSLELAYAKVVSTGCDACLFTMARIAPDGEHVLYFVEPPMESISGNEALSLTVPDWQLDTRGVYARDVVQRGQSKFKPHGHSDDELLARLCLAEAKGVTGCRGIFYYRTVSKPYTFTKVVGQTRTHIRSAQLAEERLGSSHGGVRSMRDMITRNLAGLLVRVARGEGDPQDVVELRDEVRSLHVKRMAWRVQYALLEVAVSMILPVVCSIWAHGRRGRETA